MASVNEFLSSTGQREPDLRALDELIRSTVPDMAADRHMLPMGNFDLLSYGLYHYIYASGKEGDWPAVGLANQKHYISLYICATVDNQYLAEKYGLRLGKVSVGKSCIRFKQIEDLDLEEAKNILLDTEAWWHQQPKPA